MKNNYLKNILFAALVCVAVLGKGQAVTIYTESFNSGAPVGYTQSGTEWVLDPTPGGIPIGSSMYSGFSGSFKYGASNAGAAIERLTLNNSISTLAYTNITVQWGAYREPAAGPTPAFPVLTFEWSADGITWNSAAFTDVPANSTFTGQTNVISLPAGAAGIANLRLRWSYTANNGTFYAIDDVVIQGTIIQYFSKLTGNLDAFGTWGTNGDGTGTPPSNFTSNGITYNIVNNTAPTLGANWTISGTGSKAITGDGVAGINFTIPAAFTLTGPIDVTNNSTLTIINLTIPTLGTLASASTINYAAVGAQTITSMTYNGNVTISGSGAKTYAFTTTINGILNISAGTFSLNTNAFRTLFLNGTITGAGTITGSTGSKVTIGGASGGNFGTLLFTAGSQSLHTLSINRTGAGGSIILGTGLAVVTNYNHANGILNLNGMLLTISNLLTLPVSAANGSFSGSKTSSLNIGGSGAITNSLFMNQTSATTRAMGDVILNRTGAITLTLGNALEIWGSVTPSVGTIATGGFLTLKSDASNKGRVGPLAAGGDLTGNVNVETFLPGGTTGWANLCSPGVTGQTMTNWNNTFTITCSGCPVYSVGGQPFTSVYGYVESAATNSAGAAAHYSAVTSLSDPIDVKKGYWVYLGNGFPNTTNITPVLNGPINKNNSFGGYNLTLTGAVSSENGWNLISNPYPSPISLSNMFAGNTGNIDNSILVWNADLNAGSGDWAIYSLGGATDAIPMGQGFMVRTLASVVLTGSEAWKTTSNASVQRTSNNPFDFNNLFKLNLTGGGGGKTFDTYTYFDFKSIYVPGFDNGRDVYALDNSSNNTVAQIFSKINTDNYMAAALPMLAPNGTVTIPIHISTGYAGVYSINPINITVLPGLCFELVDLVNNNVKDLYTGAYTTTIGINDGSTARFNLRVSDCGAASPVSVKENLNSNSLIFINKDAAGIFVKLNFDQSTKATISITNILGQKIIEDKNVNTAKETIYLDLLEKNQLIFVTVTTENSKVTKKFVN